MHNLISPYFQKIIRSYSTKEKLIKEILIKSIRILSFPRRAWELARLSAVLGGSAESWLRIQENYDLWKAREKVNTESLTKMNFKAVT